MRRSEIAPNHIAQGMLRALRNEHPSAFASIDCCVLIAGRGYVGATPPSIMDVSAFGHHSFRER